MFKIISKLTPLHSLVIDFSALIIADIIMNKNTIKDNIITGICIISSLIYLEILILNFCNLNENIKTNIIKRGENEMNNESDNDISSLNQKIIFDEYIF